MDVDFLFQLIAAQQGGGGGVTWSMTAGEQFSGFPGYSDTDGDGIPGGGSISNQPVPGAVLRTQLSRLSGQGPSNSDRLGFSGDVRPLVSGYSTFVVNGTSYEINGLVFVSSRTYWDVWPSPDAWPQYTAGQTYACELR